MRRCSREGSLSERAHPLWIVFVCEDVPVIIIHVTPLLLLYVDLALTPSRPLRGAPLVRPAPLSALPGWAMMAGTSRRARRHNTFRRRPRSRPRSRAAGAGAGACAHPTSERAVDRPGRGSSCYGLGRHGCWGGPSALKRKRRRRGHEPRGRQATESVRIEQYYAEREGVGGSKGEASEHTLCVGEGKEVGRGKAGCITAPKPLLGSLRGAASEERIGRGCAIILLPCTAGVKVSLATRRFGGTVRLRISRVGGLFFFFFAGLTPLFSRACYLYRIMNVRFFLTAIWRMWRGRGQISRGLRMS